MTSPSTDTLIFGAGCFWGVQDLIRKVNGVEKTEVGYCGGALQNPSYKDVCRGDTGHAESVRVVFNPQKMTLANLMDLFFSLHDPTTLNRQGNDLGTQYRSVIFYRSNEQKEEALKAMERAQVKWPHPIVTRLEPLQRFYPAEEEHQDYLQKYPGGYTCHFWREQAPKTQREKNQ